MSFDAGEFGKAFQSFLKEMSKSETSESSSFFSELLKEHMGVDPNGLPILSEVIPRHDQPNLQLALDAIVEELKTPSRWLGVSSQFAFQDPSLSALMIRPMPGVESPEEAPLEYKNTPINANEMLPCIDRGLLLLGGSSPKAVYLHESGRRGASGGISVQVLASNRDEAESFLHELRRRVASQNIFRGQIISLKMVDSNEIDVEFHELPKVERESIILPAGLLERIERETIRFAERANRLAEAGLHLKRGLLLYGPPGTGKTFSAMYLASSMVGRTVLLMTGRGLGMIRQTCAMARALQPSTVILEDVDLIAEERTLRDGCSTPFLFELLNEMDGLASDADILFLLTTNRADRLEPALAARPGRIDQAIEFPLPDAECRKRLMRLYGRNLEIDEAELDTLAQRSQGASAAFVRELMRKGAVIAAGERDPLVVRAPHLDEALRELAIQGGPLTRSLLGFQGTVSD